MAFGFHGRTAEAYNRSLLKKRTTRNKNDVFGKKNVTKLSLKTSSLSDVKNAKRIVENYKRKLRIQLVISAILTILIFILLYLLIV